MATPGDPMDDPTTNPGAGEMYLGPIAPCSSMSDFELLRDYVADPINPEGTFFNIHDIAVVGSTPWVFANSDPLTPPPLHAPNYFLLAAPHDEQTTRIEMEAPGGWTGIVSRAHQLVLLEQNWTPPALSEDVPADTENLMFELDETGATLLFHEPQDVSDITELSNGDIAMAGYVSPDPNAAVVDAGVGADGGTGVSGGWIGRFDRSGNPVWRLPETGSSAFGGTHGIDVAPDGSLYWLSNAYEGDTFFLELHKVSSNGELEWSKRHEWFVNAGIAATADGTVIIAGEAWPERLGIARYNSDGTLIYDEALNTGGTTNDLSIATAADGTTYIPWWLDFDAYVYKVTPDNSMCLFSVIPEQLPAQLVAEPDALYFAGERTVGRIPY